MPKKLRDQFIVKVQLPLFSSGGAPVMVYNEDRTKTGMFDLTVKQYRELEQAMEGEPKAFFTHTPRGKASSSTQSLRGRTGKTMPSKRSILSLLHELQRQGWQVRRGSKHYVVYPADKTKRCFTISVSPSDRNAERQIMRELRMSGYEPEFADPSFKETHRRGTIG